MNRFYILTLSIMLAVMPALSEKRSITLDTDGPEQKC